MLCISTATVSGGVIVAIILIALCIALYCVSIYYKRKNPHSHSHIRQIEMTTFKNSDLHCIDKTITAMYLKVEERICK